MEFSRKIPRGLDYYSVLSVCRNATDLEIKEAFRQLSVKFHPLRCENEDQRTFSLLAEAYDVLSHPLRKAVYDKYGEEGLKKGVPGLNPGDFIPPYVFHGEPLRTFADFFATDNPYADLLDLPEKRKMLNFEERITTFKKKKPEAVEKMLALTLLEVYFGGVKKMKIHKRVLVGDKKETTTCREKILSIPIKPGIPTGTRIIFPEEGNEGPMIIPADIIFITEDRPHESFLRISESDLAMNYNIPLNEALLGTVITVKTIDGRVLRIPVTSIVRPADEIHIPNEGLPFVNNPKEKGELVIKFNIEFPLYLPIANKPYFKKGFEKGPRNGFYVDTDVNQWKFEALNP